MWRWSVIAFALALVAAADADQQKGPAADDVALRDVLSRAADYADRYYDVMSRLTADEEYVQEVEAVRTMSPLPPSGSTPRTGAVGGQRRILRSECIVLRVGEPFGWRFYRNVLLVDNVRVRDRVERLAALFDQPAENARRLAEQIAEESARYNISAVGRVLNEPALPFVFLKATQRAAVDFKLQTRDGPVWILTFDERKRPTLFRHNSTVDNPSSGRFWVHAMTGRIQRTEHVVSPMSLRARFTTTFQNDARFDVAVPDELQEQLSTGPEVTARRVSGVAKYSNYREFRVAALDSVNR